ncbi:MAG: hypothetical protein ACRD3K_02240, partial [Edaphobacter sp.]
LIGSSVSFAQKPTISLKLLANGQRTVVGQPIVAILRLTSATPVVIDLGGNHIGNLHFSVTDSRGRKREVMLPVPDFTAPGRVNISPEVPYTQAINLSSALRIDTPGLYQIQVSLSAVSNPDIEVEVGSPADIQISPSDDKQLLIVCKDLLGRIENASSASDRLEAAGELASIHDSVAVPSMRALLGGGLGIDSLLINSLAEIGTSDAIDALQIPLTGSDPDVALLARSALLRIKSSTKDDVLRMRAEKVLQLPGRALP